MLRERGGSPRRIVQSSPRSSAGGTHHGSRACPPGFPHPRDHRTLRRRRRDRGSWTPDSTRSRRERPALVRGPGCRGGGPRQVAVPDRVRGAPGPARHRRRVLEGQGDGGALHGRGTHRGGRKMKRVSTHIEGLDEVLGGGIPEGNVVLVSGAPGTMKTSLTYHILHSSALDGSRGLRDLRCTAFLLGELPTDRTGGADPRRAAYAKHKEDYLVDGILHLRLARQGEFGMQRQLRVVKMRGTRHDAGYHALVFDNGFRVTRGFA